MANYDINYDDSRFKEVESDKSAALSDLEKTYADMINKSDDYYQAQIDASKDWAKQQSQLQQEQTDFAIQEINQQKAQEKKDYLKEQSGAFVDWRKQSNEYGSEAEKMASSGLDKSGFSESSQVSMYNTYQNRVATAREAYNLAVQNYNNAITEARLQNNSILAEIAYEALQQQLELSLQGFQYKNQLILDKANKKTELDQMYYNRYQDVLKQINTENALAEEVRQYNESLAEEKRQYDSTHALQQAQLAEEKRQFNMQYNAKYGSSGSSGGSGGSSGKSSSSKKTSSSSKASKAASVKKTQSTAKSKANSEPTVDMKSVLALGYGPISSSKLDSLVASGAVTEYEENGKIIFKKNSSKTRTSASGRLHGGLSGSW